MWKLVALFGASKCLELSHHSVVDCSIKVAFGVLLFLLLAHRKFLLGWSYFGF
jgi:hypothetical protein